MKFCHSLVLLPLLSLTAMTAQHTPVAKTPIISDFAADPTARVFGETLYIYPSHDLPGNKNWDMFDFHVYSSTDGKTFTDLGKIFSVDDLTWAKHQLWAPDCVAANGKYYLYFAAEGQIGVAVSDKPTGPFKDALGKPLLGKRTAGLYTIDVQILQDTDGTNYLYYGNSNGKVGFAKLNPDMISLATEIRVLDMPHYHEGIWVFKKDDTYYATYPSGRGKTVANLMEYSTSKSPDGPWEHKGEILDNLSRNVHGSVVQFKGEWYVVYHIQGPSPYERRTYMDKLTFNADGTIVPLGKVTGMPEPTTQPAR